MSLEVLKEAIQKKCKILFEYKFGKISGKRGTEREIQMKAKTLELYRRNLRNIDILLYDEIYDRARFIVEGE